MKATQAVLINGAPRKPNKRPNPHESKNLQVVKHTSKRYYAFLSFWLFRSGFEPLTQGFSVLCSNQLSYRNIYLNGEKTKYIV